MFEHDELEGVPYIDFLQCWESIDVGTFNSIIGVKEAYRRPGKLLP